MGVHLIHEAYLAEIRKLVIVGTVCSYPKYTPVPFHEEQLWDGYPEETNAPYGLAKKMLLVQAQAYRAEYGVRSAFVIPTNLSARRQLRRSDEPRDSRDHQEVHHGARGRRRRSRPLGFGGSTREFLYVDDAAEGVALALQHLEDPDPINLGSATEISIRDLADKIARITGFDGRFAWDRSNPDGQPRRAVDGSKAAQLLGWTASVGLDEGLKTTVDWYRQHRS